MKKVLGIVGIIAVAIIVLLLVFKLGFGLGPGKGAGDGSGESKQQTQSEEEQKEEDKEVTDMDKSEEVAPEDLPDTITVTIKEDKVYVEDKQIKDEGELKDYLEKINNDDREYRLKEDNSILDTYEWVNKVFDDLKIQLVPASE